MMLSREEPKAYLDMAPIFTYIDALLANPRTMGNRYVSNSGRSASGSVSGFAMCQRSRRQGLAHDRDSPRARDVGREVPDLRLAPSLGRIPSPLGANW